MSGDVRPVHLAMSAVRLQSWPCFSESGIAKFLMQRSKLQGSRQEVYRECTLERFDEGEEPVRGRGRGTAWLRAGLSLGWLG